LLEAEVYSCHSFLLLLQAMERHRTSTSVWMITRGALAVDAGDAIAVAQFPAIGIARTAMIESQRLAVRLVDLQPESADRAAQQLWREICAGDAETEVAWRSGARFASRVSRTRLESLDVNKSKARKPRYASVSPHPE
jgi:hypothetical protein